MSTRRSDKPSSAGAQAVAGLVKKHGATAVAKKLGSSEAAVRAWATGARGPRGAARAALASTYGVPEGGWPGPGKATSRRAQGRTRTGVAPELLVAADAPLLERYRMLGRETELALATARADPNTSPRDLASLVQSLARTYAHIGRLTGESEITLTMIARSAAWREFALRLEQVLAKHPAAAADVAALFASLDEAAP